MAFEYRSTERPKRFLWASTPSGLEEARERRDETRKQIAAGIDPGEKCKAMKSNSSPIPSLTILSPEQIS